MSEKAKATGTANAADTKCPCKGDYLDKFIQPSALTLLLSEGPAHGFHLLARLEALGLLSEADATGFYRSLRKLEKDGKLSSEWGMEEGQRPRKVYAITDVGVRCLQNWQNTLHNYLADVKRISKAVDRALETR